MSPHSRPGAQTLSRLPVRRRVHLLLVYADTDLLELFHAGLVLVFAGLSFYVHATTGYPPATTAYAHFTSSPLFSWGCLVIGVVKVVAVVHRRLVWRLCAALPLTGLYTTLAVLAAAANVRALGWTFFGYLALTQIGVTARLAADIGREWAAVRGGP